MKINIVSNQQKHKDLIQSLAKYFDFESKIISPERFQLEVQDQSAETFFVLDASTPSFLLIKQHFDRKPRFRANAFCIFESTTDLNSKGELIRTSQLPHFLFWNDTGASEISDHLARLINFGIGGSKPGLENLIHSRSDLESWRLEVSTDKNRIVEKAILYFRKWGCAPRQAAEAGGALDELLLNAIYDAPVDEKGSRIYSHVPRSTKVNLYPDRIVDVQIALDGTHIGALVADKWGSLDRVTVLNHVAKSTLKNLKPTNDGTEHCGLGLALNFKRSMSMMFQCQNGKLTQVSMFFHKRIGQRVRDFQFLSVL